MSELRPVLSTRPSASWDEHYQSSVEACVNSCSVMQMLLVIHDITQTGIDHIATPTLEHINISWIQSLHWSPIIVVHCYVFWLLWQGHMYTSLCMVHTNHALSASHDNSRYESPLYGTNALQESWLSWEMFLNKAHSLSSSVVATTLSSSSICVAIMEQVQAPDCTGVFNSQWTWWRPSSNRKQVDDPYQNHVTLFLYTYVHYVSDSVSCI